MHIIVDPFNYDKLLIFNESKQLVNEFLDHNSLNRPSDIVDSSVFNVKRLSKLRVDYGFYETFEQRINVNVKKSRTPVKTPGFQWSYTGYKADLTITGIMAHEVGHHVHTLFGSGYSRSLKGFILDFTKFIHNESSVSSYEPNPYEMFAESMRLFIINPSLLQEGRKKRYEYIVSMGLKPIVDLHWREVLVNAHSRLICGAESWIKKK